MKVRIIKASKPTYWYADCIGECFFVRASRKYGNVYAIDGTAEWSRGNLVHEADCEVVE